MWLKETISEDFQEMCIRFFRNYTPKMLKLLCWAFIREKMWEPLQVERHATYFFNCNTYAFKCPSYLGRGNRYLHADIQYKNELKMNRHRDCLKWVTCKIFTCKIKFLLLTSAPPAKINTYSFRFGMF